jgi:hypothetical protein
MLPEIHTLLRTLLYDVGRINPLEVDILFEAPTLERFQRMTRPAISIYLFDVRENLDLRNTSFPTTKTATSAQRRMPPRRIDLYYMVSALSTDVDDEFRLLWRALATLMRHPDFPDEMLPEELRYLQTPLRARPLQGEDAQRSVDIWSALSMEPHPSFSYIVTAPMELDVAIDMPLVLTNTTRYGRGATPLDRDTFINIGGIVRDSQGEGLEGVLVAIEGSAKDPVRTNALGQYRLIHVPVGELKLLVSRAGGANQSVTITVPSDSYDFTLG